MKTTEKTLIFYCHPAKWLGRERMASRRWLSTSSMKMETRSRSPPPLVFGSLPRLASVSEPWSVAHGLSSGTRFMRMSGVGLPWSPLKRFFLKDLELRVRSSLLPSLFGCWETGDLIFLLCGKRKVLYHSSWFYLFVYLVVWLPYLLVNKKT